MSERNALPVVRRRGSLSRASAAIKAGRITVGFIGGSITDGRVEHNWPDPVCRWLVNEFPGLTLVVENAAIGATGSDLAALRARRDLIDRGCDLVFVEYAVNDFSTPTQRRQRSREGLLRQLLADGRRDVVLVYTYCQDMYKDMIAGKAPASIAEFEALGDHYGLSSVWMALHTFREVQAGLLRWEDWLPDQLHPGSRGSLIYAQAVISLLERELKGKTSRPADKGAKPAKLPKPIDTLNWEKIELYPFERITREGPWMLKRWLHHRWIDQSLETAAVGAKLSFEFKGRGLCLGFDFGRLSSEFRYRLDDGTLQTETRDRPSWCGDTGWFRPSLLGEEMKNGRHKIDIEVIHGDSAGCTGTNFRLGLIGVIK